MVEKKLFKDYFANKITVEELIERLELHQQEFPFRLQKELEKALAGKDPEWTEDFIYALFLWKERVMAADRVSLNFFTDILNRLLLCEWHKQHENIVALLQEISEERSVEVLYQVIYLKLPYLEWDDNYSFPVKCVRAISSIRGELAGECLKLLSGEDNPIIRAMAERKYHE